MSLTKDEEEVDLDLDTCVEGTLMTLQIYSLKSEIYNWPISLTTVFALLLPWSMDSIS